MKTAINITVTLVIAMFFCSGIAFGADSNFDQGLKLYNQQNYKMAAAYFDMALQAAPTNTTAMYYDALSYHQLGDVDHAKQLYSLITKVSPGSQAAQLSAVALRTIGTSSTRSTAASTTTRSSSDSSGLPDETKIYFTRMGKELLVDTEVNNRSVKMIFDTGAELCVFGKNQLQQLSIRVPAGAETGEAHGVGSSGAVKFSKMNVDLKVGSIVRHNFPIVAQEELLTPPLLGQTFFQDYQYSIDNGANTISFKKKSMANAYAGRDNNSVPFRRLGNEIIVNVEVNGRQCPMIFDTGAESIVFFPQSLQQLGISVPEDAQSQMTIGAGGSATARQLTINRMKMGPIDKSNISATVVEQSGVQIPLLGQEFYRDWQYTIDNNQHVIHFLRR